MVGPAIDKRPFYAVRRGRRRGVFRTWGECLRQTRKYSRAEYKKFARREDADAWLAGDAMTPEESDRTVCYSDGSSIGNGTPTARAGVGVWFGENDARNVCEPLAGDRQTNQRAEIQAAIRALEVGGCNLEIRTDSRYVVRAATEWIPRAGGWLERDFEGVANADLFRRLWELVETHRPRFMHVPGHANVAGNERADALARRGAQQ